MTEQAKLKAQAYKSNLKSRALSVLIYLIDRSNKELTCFPAISTMSEQLHISVSTVKRALRELTQEGYVEKNERFRDNRGQTSNLYTLVFKEDEHAIEKKNNTEKQLDKKCVDAKTEHITFETLAREYIESETLDVKSESSSQSDLNPRVKGILNNIFHTSHVGANIVSVSMEKLVAFCWTGEEVNLIPP